MVSMVAVVAREFGASPARQHVIGKISPPDLGPERNQSYLYIGDIGDNSERRSEIIVYRVPEPTITAADASSTKSKPRVTESAEAIHLRYPDGKHDAETLMVHPVTGSLFIVTKVVFSNPGVYEAAGPVTSEKPSHLTALES